MPVKKPADKQLENFTGPEAAEKPIIVAPDDEPLGVQGDTGPFVDIYKDVSSVVTANLKAKRAFLKAQMEIGNTVTKDSENAFFKNPQGKPSSFASLNAVLEVIYPPLHMNGLSLIMPQIDIDGRTHVKIHIFHEDGGELPPSFYPVISKDMTNPQAFGAGVTYARRYALMAYFGLGAEDDDGNTAATPPKPAVSATVKQLGDKLKAAGFTRDSLRNEMRTRFGNADLTVGKLTDDQAQGWLDELNAAAEGIPF